MLLKLFLLLHGKESNFLNYENKTKKTKKTFMVVLNLKEKEKKNNSIFLCKLLNLVWHPVCHNVLMYKEASLMLVTPI